MDGYFKSRYTPRYWDDEWQLVGRESVEAWPQIYNTWVQTHTVLCQKSVSCFTFSHSVVHKHSRKTTTFTFLHIPYRYQVHRNNLSLDSRWSLLILLTFNAEFVVNTILSHCIELFLPVFPDLTGSISAWKWLIATEYVSAPLYNACRTYQVGKLHYDNEAK